MLAESLAEDAREYGSPPTDAINALRAVLGVVMGGGNRGSGKGGNRKWADDAWSRNLPLCPRCGVPKRDQCRTRRGRPCKPHRLRATLGGEAKP